MRIGLVTLGCDKNTVDAEYLAGLLEARGCEVLCLDEVEPDAPLDAVVVTTCGFIADAKQQSIETVVALAETKRATGNPKLLYVTGCLSQRYAKDLLRDIPGIDGIAGVGQFETLAEMVAEGRGKRNAVRPAPSVNVCRPLPRRPLDAKPYAFLKIADGCDHRCAFCSIPLIKGRLRSVPREILIEEARLLLARGVREINLVAQDISVYGVDLPGRYRLPDLLQDLCAIEGDFWIRCLYCYPSGVTDVLLDLMVSEPKIARYLDIPLQHLDPELLQHMKRPYHDLNGAALVERLRSRVPGITLRTTMLIGFPGETAAAHRRMLDGMRRIEFDRLGAFKFSPEEDTVAATAPKQVSEAVREKRWHAVMQFQAGISAQLNQRRIGSRPRVLIEAYDPDRRLWVGRSQAEAPDVDGKVFVESPSPLQIGEFYTVEITQSDVYDLTGAVVA